MKEKLIDFFDDLSLADSLARMRAKQSQKRHSKVVLDRFFSGLESSHATRIDPLNDPAWYMPPRRLWSRPNLSSRLKKDRSTYTKCAIMRTVVWAIKNDQLDKYEWGRRFRELAERIRERIKRGDFQFESPTVLLIKVSSQKNRFVSVFRKLEDKIIQRQTALYLRQVFEHKFSSHSYSFRNNPHINHARAVADLVRYREIHSGEVLRVSECDICKFFDVIDHQVAWKTFERLAREIKVEALARKAVKGYLACYTSTDTLLAQVRKEDSEACLEYVEGIKAVLKTIQGRADNQSCVPRAVGLPQGGTLSMLLANCVLQVADEAVAHGADDQLFYARYCDDSIIVHPNEKECANAQRRYLSALKKLRLPYHEMKNDWAYGKEFYSAKSKTVFQWRDLNVAGELNVSPWVSFLGNQVKFDGEVRIRQDTITRHLNKLKDERKKYLGLIYAACQEGSGIKIRNLDHPLTISHMLEMMVKSLVAKGVGYLRPGRSLTHSLCWLSAFPNIRGKSCENQLRQLDAARARILYPLQKKGDVSYYMGRPMSYYGFFVRVMRPRLESTNFKTLSEKTMKKLLRQKNCKEVTFSISDLDSFALDAESFDLVKSSSDITFDFATIDYSEL